MKGHISKPMVSRREFVMATLATGFASSTRPVSADTISTDTEGRTAGELTIPVRDETVPAYRAAPEKGGPFPTEQVVREIFGVHERIRDVCRLAKLGYRAVAPELYARQCDVSKLAMQDIVGRVVSKVPDARVMADLDATAA